MQIIPVQGEPLAACSHNLMSSNRRNPEDEHLLKVYKIMPIEYTWLIISSQRNHK